MSTMLRGSTLGQYSSVHIALIALKTHLLGSKAASSEWWNFLISLPNYIDTSGQIVEYYVIDTLLGS